jgi:hypothetical protein
MIHISRSPSGFTVSTINSDDNKQLLSSTGRQNFSSMENVLKNIRAQMSEWNSGVYVYVQDNTGSKPVVLEITQDEVLLTERPTESTKESRKAKKDKKKDK